MMVDFFDEGDMTIVLVWSECDLHTKWWHTVYSPYHEFQGTEQNVLSYQ